MRKMTPAERRATERRIIEIKADIQTEIHSLASLNERAERLATLLIEIQTLQEMLEDNGEYGVSLN
jgi:hypothetical protein